MSNVVYYIGIPGADHVKIGTTKSLTSRLKSLATAHHDGDKLTVLATEPGSYPLEEQRHRQFAGSRGHGEWFKLTPELRAHIDALALRNNPAFIKGYDEGYQTALADRAVHPLITCEICGDDRSTPYGHIDDEEFDNICPSCNTEAQMAIETTDVGWMLVRAYGYDRALEIASVLPGTRYTSFITAMKSRRS